MLEKRKHAGNDKVTIQPRLHDFQSNEQLGLIGSSDYCPMPAREKGSFLPQKVMLSASLSPKVTPIIGLHHLGMDCFMTHKQLLIAILLLYKWNISCHVIMIKHKAVFIL